MLYDILIIDDDFGENSDSQQLADNANTLLSNLIRDNLRVTWTTGEIDDLAKLEKKDLSTICYIFLDLHLEGLDGDSLYKDINSAIVGILTKLAKHISHDNVICFVNSKYVNESNYGDAGIQHLKESLKKLAKYTVEIVEKEKNNLSDEQKKLLLENNVQVYLKTLIISKLIEVEKVFDNRLKIDEKLRPVITFSNKFKIFNREFNLCPDYKTQIQLLQQIRNKLAHSEDDLSGITGGEKQKFWEIIENSSEKDDPIKFETFDQLVKYINSVDILCEYLKNAKENTKK